MKSYAAFEGDIRNDLNIGNDVRPKPISLERTIDSWINPNSKKRNVGIPALINDCSNEIGDFFC